MNEVRLINVYLHTVSHSRALFFCKGSEDRFEDDECDSDGLVAEGSNPVKDKVSIIFL